MGFSRQEHWSGLPFPSPGHLPNPGSEPKSPALQAGFFIVCTTKEALIYKFKDVENLHLQRVGREETGRVSHFKNINRTT